MKVKRIPGTHNAEMTRVLWEFGFRKSYLQVFGVDWTGA